jgi:hypothetical protein
VAERAHQFTPHRQCICSVIRELTWLETSPWLSGAECQKEERLALRVANTQLIQEFPDLLICIKGLILTRVDAAVKPLPIEYSYAQGYEWTIS